MQKTSGIPLGIKVIIVFYLLNIILRTVGQGGAVIAYDTVAEWGLQDSRELIDSLIVQINRSIGLTDMITMIPVFIIAVMGLIRMKFWGAVASWMVFGISFMCLASFMLLNFWMIQEWI